MTDPHSVTNPFPSRVAAIDAGSNAIRFVAAEFSGPLTFEVLEYERVPVRLGHQVFLNGKLATETMESAAEAFRRFRIYMDDLRVENYRAVATSAVREAHNGHILIEQILRSAGIRLEPITGFEEARLVHFGVSNRIDLQGGQWILADLGGGSVEVSLVDDVGILWSESHTMGSVRLLEELSASSQDAGRFQSLLAEYVSVLRIPSSTQYWDPHGFICTGGNIEALAKLAGAEPNERGTCKLPVSDLEAIIELLSRLSYRQRMEQLELRQDRADVILPAAIVYNRLAELCGVSEILVPGTGVKDGILLDLVDDLSSHAGHEARQMKQLTTAALALGRRYMFDEAHGTQVGNIATSIYDQVENLHGLNSRDRQILYVASLLHDIGFFVSHEKHHKHSLYILSRSELPGFSKEEMLMVANVARYHRKSTPSPHHMQYMRLPYPLRMKVTQLAAILRIADSLDRQHVQAVDEVEVVRDGREVRFVLKGSNDLLLERWAFARRKGVFEETFGISAKIDLA